MLSFDDETLHSKLCIVNVEIRKQICFQLLHKPFCMLTLLKLLETRKTHQQTSTLQPIKMQQGHVKTVHMPIKMQQGHVETVHTPIYSVMF